MDVGDIGEWKLVELIREKLELSCAENVLVDIGDDAACVKLNESTILTIDSYLEDVHFSLQHYSYYDVGYRSLASSLSDVAAMGGTPKFALISLQIPPTTSVKNVEHAYSGMLELANRFDFRIIGGDTVKSRSVGIVCAIIGQTEEAIQRKGAKVGDSILLTGEIGSSSFGLYLMNSGINEPQSLHFVEAHKKPIARIEEGRVLSASGVVSAMIDISDGLSTDIHHLTKESGVGALVHFDKIPVNEKLCELADEQNVSSSDFVLYGGEDYELLFTLPPQQAGKVCKDIELKTGTKTTEIGRVTEGKKVELEKNGQRIPLPRRGYDHFKKSQ